MLIRGGLLCVLGLLAPLAVTAGPPLPPAEPSSVAPPAAMVAWIRRHATPADQPLDAAEAAAIHRVIAGASVIGFGETGHGSGEPLEYRNRLIRHLVEHEGLTAVALESGLAGTKRLGDYGLGGPGDPERLVHEDLSWGFGGLEANLELVNWLRDHNSRHPGHLVHLYGMDASVMLTSGPSPQLDASLILGDLLAYLDRALPTRSGDVRRRLAGFEGRFRSDSYTAMTAIERADLRRGLDKAERLFAANREAMIAASSPDDYAWAAREAHDARALPAFLGDWTTEFPPDLTKLINLIRIRDQIMADNVAWLMAREGPYGRMLVFAANGHVAAAPMIGSVMRRFPSQPDTMGTILRRRLGARYRVILTASSRGRLADDATIGSLDRAFAEAGETRALLAARSEPRQTGWSRVQTLSQGDHRIDDVTPRRAFDGLLFFDVLHPAPAFRPPG